MHRVLNVEGVEVQGGVGKSVDADFACYDVGFLHLEGENGVKRVR